MVTRIVKRFPCKLLLGLCDIQGLTCTHGSAKDTITIYRVLC